MDALLSFIFSLSSLPNPLWNRAYSAGDEIHRYVEEVANQFGVKRYVRFDTMVTEAVWLEEEQGDKIGLNFESGGSD